MKRNTAGVDRVIRGTAGVVSGWFGIANITAWWGIGLLIVAIILVFTALFGW